MANLLLNAGPLARCLLLSELASCREAGLRAELCYAMLR
jgi:hypothetical protein